MAMTYKEFYDKFYPYAKVSASKISGGAPPEVILAFWFWETGRGTNRGTKEFNNLAGINYNRAWRNPLQLKPSPSGEYAVYSNLNNFAEDYARVLNLSMYSNVRNAFKTAGYEDDVASISASPYSVDDYDKPTVLNAIKEFRKLSGSPAPTYDADASVNTFVSNAKVSGVDTTTLALAMLGAVVLLLKK